MKHLKSVSVEKAAPKGDDLGLIDELFCDVFPGKDKCDTGFFDDLF